MSKENYERKNPKDVNEDVESVNEVTENKKSSDKSSRNSSKILFWIPFLILLVLVLAAIAVIIVYFFVIRSDYTDEVRPISEPWKQYRLPKHIIPIEYDLYMFPDMYNKSANSFKGHETIALNVKESTYFIILNSYLINVTSIRVLNFTNFKELKIMKNFTYVETQMLVIEMKHILPRNSKLQLEMTFRGTLQRDLSGFYKSFFTSPSDNQTKYMATTKFEPVSARKAFPCLDEPHLKAFFTIHLVHRHSHQALSNMPIFDRTQTLPMIDVPNSYVISNFRKTTVPMSTYLVAFIVCESYESTLHGSPLRPMRVFAPSHRINDTLYAGNIGIKGKQFLDTLLDFQSPLPKVDMIYIPHFSSGAMENWGLITYRERSLLSTTISYESSKFRICRVVAHELAHTWFGNIVTMAWWDDIWLNEGFATYFARLTMENVCPDWNITNVDFTKTRGSVFLMDAKPSAVSIKMNTQDPKNLRKMFNGFVYSKGAALLYWINCMMGDKNFIEGIQSYIKEKQYNVANTNDLWRHLGRKFPNIQEMDTFLYQKGLPYITVSYHPENKSLSFKQDRFMWYPSRINVSETSRFNFTWSIWVKYQTSENTNEEIIFMPKNVSTVYLQLDDNIDFTSPESNSWIFFNSDTSGYYRVMYDLKLFLKLFKAMLKSSTYFSSIQRATFIDDASSLAYSGVFPYAPTLTLWKLMRQELETAPWITFVRNVYFIFKKMKSSAFNEYIKNTYSSVFKLWNIDSPDRYIENRKAVLFIRFGCTFKNPDCGRLMGNNFKRIMQGLNLTIPNYLRNYVYKFGLEQEDTQENWNKLIKLLNETTEDNFNIVNSICNSNSPARFQDFVTRAQRQEISRSLDFNVIVRHCKDQFCLDELWLWLKQNCNGTDSHPNCDRFVFRSIQPLTKYFNTEKELDDVTSFFDRLPIKVPDKLKNDTVIKRIRENINWMETRGYQIIEWLDLENTEIIL